MESSLSVPVSRSSSGVFQHCVLLGVIPDALAATDLSPSSQEMMKLLKAIPNINGEFVKVEQDGQLIAFCCYAWVHNIREVLRVDQGEEVCGDGKVLYVFNLRIEEDDPSLIWALKRKLPPAKWIVGLDDSYQLHQPKGVPDDFFR